MPEFLSPEWIDALDRAARGAHPPVGLPRPLTVDYVVDHGPGPGRRADARYHVSITSDGFRVRPGPAPRADLAFVTDRSTAYALHTGAVGAQDAFASGRLKVKGDLNVLAGARPVLTALDDVFGAVRAETTPAPGGYDPEPAEPEVGP